MNEKNIEKPDEKPEKPELTADEKAQILREAVSYYIRTNYLQGDTLKTCEDFIADIDQKVRGQVASSTGAEHHHSSGGHATDYPPPKPKAK